MGVYQKPDGRWVMEKMWKGQRFFRSFGKSKRAKRMAEMAYAELDRRLELGEVIGEQVRPISFEDFAEEYLAYSESNKAKNTYDREKITVECHLAPYFAGKMMAVIHPNRDIVNSCG